MTKKIETKKLKQRKKRKELNNTCSKLNLVYRMCM